MSTPGSRRRRPHPARRARKLAGWVSIASMVALTGVMATTAKFAVATTTATTPATTPAPTAPTSAAPSAVAIPGYDSTSRSATVSAIAATPSTPIDTSTHAS